MALQVTTLEVTVGSPDDARCTLSEAGETIDVVRVSGMDYVRASARVWMSVPAVSNAGTASRAEGKYVRVAMRSAKLGRLAKLLDVSRALSDELAATETATIGGTAIINGVPTVAITPITPGLSPLPIGSIYVATVGETTVDPCSRGTYRTDRECGPAGLSPVTRNFVDHKGPFDASRDVGRSGCDVIEFDCGQSDRIRLEYPDWTLAQRQVNGLDLAN